MAMRSTVSVLIALLLVATLVPPTASAEPILTDPQDDVAFVASGGIPAQTVPVSAPPHTDGADLTALEIAETDDDLTFVVSVVGLEQEVAFGSYMIEFTWKRVQYRADVYRTRSIDTNEEYVRGYLRSLQDGWYQTIAELSPSLDLTQGTVTVSVPKVLILSKDQRMPLKGDKLTDLAVRTQQLPIYIIAQFRMEDRMPDSGFIEYTLQKGAAATGHLLLGSQDPVRVSNGGSTTFVFKTSLLNKADFVDEVDLKVDNLPDGWTATVQSPLTIPANDERTVHVLASVPFAHKHGGFDSFNLTATSREDPSATTSLRLGVLHTPIPQPAGHHQDLFLHGNNSNTFEPFATLFPWVTTYMNTDSGHEEDEEYAPPTSGGSGSSGSYFSWFIPLGPELAMGLDFDTNKTGVLTSSVLGNTVTGSATVTAELYHGAPEGYWGGDGSGVLLADSAPVDVTLDVQNAAPFSLTLSTTEDADYVPYTPGENMWLKLQLQTEGFHVCCIRSTTPWISISDFRMTLPLNEYHDRLTGVAEGELSVSLTADGPVEKTGRPGDVLTYAFTLKNGGASAEKFVLDVAGTDASAGAVVPSGDVKLKPGESRKVTLAVRLPAEAADGQTLEVLLFARAESDPSKMAIARTKTTASVEVAGADETDVLLEAQQQERDTPGPGALASVAALGAALLVARSARRGSR